jgi:hypothetical protein
MKYEKTVPCPFCPFRKDALAGWLGANTPEQMAWDALNEIHLPCHKTVDYEKADWQRRMYLPESGAQHCAGARACAKKSYQLPRDPVLRKAQDSLFEEAVDMVMTGKEFIDYHNAARTKSWEMKRVSERRERGKRAGLSTAVFTLADSPDAKSKDK